MDLEKFPSREEAAVGEMTAIATKGPLYNVTPGGEVAGGRPRLEDPTVPIAFRMRRSAWEWFCAEARRVGLKPTSFLRQTVERLAEENQP